ncbi:lipopolysaccharide biosynthesis protein [Dinghuibacter silviterrae]|uniref:O-antigen/teichoic acid export membrane protein n=1 Tax=Dinghuibacter silviterrae TaxID=1539049 RepID=A0A4V3GLL8_9BACT|nr:lipopolysaccharide biosynthesis protein [Dinghuibacter silviterrae]TDX00033.1 O-antigen/teichoic acid export membrane protein [Dinghuibacter silviterrae]
MSLRKKTIAGIFWSVGQQFTMLGLNLGVSVILARLMPPSQFGLIGMVAIFIAVGEALIGGGLGAALIRDKDPDALDYSTVFISNVGVGVFLYVLLFATAPLIAAFFRQEVLTPIIRVYMLTILMFSFSGIQSTRLTREMNFKKLAACLLPSELLSGILGVVLAYKGYGVWSLVWMNFAQAALFTVFIWTASGWRPGLAFSRTRFRKHFTFGANFLLTTLLDRVYQNIYAVVISKFYQPAQVGYYTRSYSLVMIPVDNLFQALVNVTFPAFASIQSDTEKLLRAHRKLMQQALFILLPVMMMMILTAEPLFRWLLTDKWLPAVPYFRLLCLAGMVLSGNGYFQNILMAKGRSDLLLKVMIIEKVLITLGICSVFPFGIKGLLYYQVFSSVVLFAVNGYIAGKLVGYPLYEQLKDIAPIFGITAIAALPAYMADQRLTGLHDILRIVVVCTFYGVVYLALFFAFRTTEIRDFRELVLKGLVQKLKPWKVAA